MGCHQVLGVAVSIVLLSTIIQLVSGQTVTITNPLVGNVGGSVEIVCSALNSEGEFANPDIITLRRDGAVFIDVRLSSRDNNPNRTYTLENLAMEDNGIELQCAASEVNSVQVTLQVLFPPVINGFSGDSVTGGVASLVAGEGTTITFDITSSLLLINTIEPVAGSSSSVPMSLSVSGNMVLISNVGRNDQGTYFLVSTNPAGSAKVTFTIEVEYAPFFNESISEEFTCGSSATPSSYLCASRMAQAGTFSCAFLSNPAGSLSISIDVPDNTTVSVEGSRIAIGSSSEANAGTYTCVASNTIRGVLMSASREITFLVGDVPSAVSNNSATVVSGGFLIEWSHTQLQEDIPLTGFSIVGGPIGAMDTINSTVAADVFQLMLDLDVLDVGTNYNVTIRAINLLGLSEGRDVLFRPTSVSTPVQPSTIPPTTVSQGHTSPAVRTTSHLLTILLVILCALFFRQ